MAEDPTEIARVRLLEALMKKVAEDQYPSTTMMDIIEEMLTEEHLEAYAEILLAHIENEQFPSMPMIARLRDLALPA